jgi:hypothetical protein
MKVMIGKQITDFTKMAGSEGGRLRKLRKKGGTDEQGIRNR